MKFLMSSYGERSFVLASIVELNVVHSDSLFLGKGLKIDLGLYRFFALFGSETPVRLRGYRVFVLLRGEIAQNKRLVPRFSGQAR